MTLADFIDTLLAPFTGWVDAGKVVERMLDNLLKAMRR